MAINSANLRLRPTNLVDYLQVANIRAPLAFSAIINRVDKNIYDQEVIQGTFIWA